MKNSFTKLFSLLFLGAVGSASAQTLFSEDFNSTSGTAIPATWTQTTGATDGGFKSGTNSGLSSSTWTIPAANGRVVATNDDGCNCDKSNELLSTPAIDMSGVSNAYLSFKAFFYAGSYNGATESAKVRVSTDAGTTWTDVMSLQGAAGWQSITTDISSYAGNADVRIGFYYNDGSGWTYGLGLDDVSVFVPSDLDVSLTSNNMVEYAVMGNVPVTGTFYNSGVQTITSLSVSYSVDGGTPVTGMLNGISVAPLTSYDFTHPTAWNATAPGTYSVALSISMPNGSADSSPNDNSASATVNIATQSVTALPLVEEFSSNTCPPCASFNATFIPLLETNHTNLPDGLVAAVKYQMDWPSPGTDKSYNPDGETRRAFYGVTGIPDAYIDGYGMGGTQADLDNAADRIAVIDIQVNAVYYGNTITAEVTATPYANFPAGLRLFIALTEDHYNDSGTNGETDFHYVMRKMMSTGNGITLPAMTPGNSVTESRSFDATFGSVAQGNYNLWGSNFDGVTIVAWVQNTTTGQVFQAAIDESVVLSTATPEELYVKLFPNPVADNLFVRADLQGSEGLQVNIFNSLGQKVASQAFASGATGYQNFNVSTEGLSNGVYMVQMISGNKMSTRSVIVNR
ncbi:MAG: T9SS type A sorting domain-containing protein [Bacteroidetes bacterium]|nr:T9SS type A sorting domain-containing protein [Bacteroidota bacterium]